MDMRIRPHALAGTLIPPPSKSMQHRCIIAELLAEGRTEIVPASEDAERTKAAMLQLLHGASEPVDCGSSGTTLRFLLPLAAVLAPCAEFTGTPRLLARPLGEALAYVRTERGLRLSGEKLPERIILSAERSSQDLSGLLFALPLLPGEHSIILRGECVSRPYIAMTLAVLRGYGIRIDETEWGFRVPGRQHYVNQKTLLPERDWSHAAFFLAAKALGMPLEVEGLRRPSLQGDAAVETLLADLPDTVALADTPDLLPPLALYAALREGKHTVFTSLAHLRGKESDRIESVAAALAALGAGAESGEDTLTVRGVKEFCGGRVNAMGDHRIAMLAALAAPFSTGEILLHGAETVKKSYPGFWNEYRRVGGEAEEVR